MLVFDQLRRADQQLRWLSALVLVGLGILLAGLWYVQVAVSQRYQESLKVQTFRTVRVPAPRGRIIDRHGALLAENQPKFQVNLYLEDLREQFKYEYTNSVRRQFLLTNPGRATREQSVAMQGQARYQVVSNLVWQVSSRILGSPLILNARVFARHYVDTLALPLPIINNLTPEQVAIFMERCGDLPGVELEVQPMRNYPNGNTAVHVLGFLQREDEIPDGDEMVFRYRLPDYVGKAGVEGAFDEELRGKAGVKSILVNNIGYRMREDQWAPIEVGQNLQLTIDLGLQKVAENALRMSGPETRGAAVVVDVRNGDVLALASSPSFNPNSFLGTISVEENTRLTDVKLTPYINRAVYAAYAPGSIFKIVVSLAALESGLLDPANIFYNVGYSMVGRRRIKDTAPAGNFDFKDAFKYSCNSYFIDYGLKVGPQRLIEMGNVFGFGQKTGVVSSRQERSGYFPKSGLPEKKDGTIWMDGDTANLSIGQGEIVITPVQAAMMTAAVANGGTVYKPRLVRTMTHSSVLTSNGIDTVPSGVVRGLIPVKQQHLQQIRSAMLADVEETGGTGMNSFVPGMRVCGKTGTAQVLREGNVLDYVTWFVSFAPFESPRYAVVVMVESGASGGATCAPKAREIYKALLARDQKQGPGWSLAGGVSR